jgi:hypothetical protein
MILAVGMCSSSIAQFAAYPLALTRTRLQAQGIGGRPIKYRGMMDVLRKTVQHEGVRGLYKVSLCCRRVGCTACASSGWCSLCRRRETKVVHLSMLPTSQHCLFAADPLSAAALCTAPACLQGSLTNLAKVAPAAGISWLVFEQAKTAMAVDMRR